MDQAGYIYLWRKIRNYRHWPGNINKSYTKFEAWLDLIMAVEFEPTTKYFNDRKINLDRGQVIASYRYLANRWKWSTCKVASFLDDLKTNTEIKTDEISGITVITLLNYKDLQTPLVFLNNKKKTVKKTVIRQQKDKVKKAKEAEKEILYIRLSDQKGLIGEMARRYKAKFNLEADWDKGEIISFHKARQRNSHVSDEIMLQAFDAYLFNDFDDYFKGHPLFKFTKHINQFLEGKV